MNPARLRRWLTGRAAVIGVPYGWLLAFFLAPFLLLAKISVSEMETVHFKDLLVLRDGLLTLTADLGNYIFITQDALYYSAFLASLKYAFWTTLLCLAIGYPFAYFMARARATLQPALLMLVMLPFWTSLVINSAINPLTALLRVPNGELLERPSAREMMRALALETAEVAKAEQVTLAFADPGCRGGGRGPQNRLEPLVHAPGCPARRPD